MISRLQLTGIAAVGAIMLLIGTYHLGKYTQYQQFKYDEKLSRIENMLERAKVDETINNMDNVALCLELGGVREQCKQLRGLATDKP